MSWTSLRRFYGLQRPYNFRVAIPFLLNTIGASITVAAIALMLSNDLLTVGTQRFYFFLYVFAAFLLAALLSRLTRVSFAIFAWCALEAAVVLTSYSRESAGFSLLPKDLFTQPPNRRFIYHPLLQGIPRRNWEQVIHFDPRYQGKPSNWPWNWKQLEKEIVFHHNSFGLRGRELSAKDFSLDMIFVYGGSTTYDATVTQGETWVEHVQSELNSQYTLLNFGIPGHSTAEHLIYTAFYQQIGGKRPVCAVYYVGWNDIHNAHIDNLDRAYADWHLLHPERKPEVWAAKYSPVIRLLNTIASRRFDTVPQPPPPPKTTSTARDLRLESIFSDNVRTIAAINRSRGIRTVFIGQVLNRSYFLLRPNDANAHAPGVKNQDMWPLQERFNTLLRETAASMEAAYIDAGIDNFKPDDFTTQGHFSAIGARKFARLVARNVVDSCR